SGLGKVLPRGFPVGTIFQVSDEITELSRMVSVVSMTDLNTLEELFIVVGGRDWDSEEIFEKLEKVGTGQ
ncbi:MAG TPA: rod shape-determining protein MreC, partial [Candidatus Krumholzibacterium sp.]|nr:rod shape-determining protein MreC [Candidatus Krumholzibacterium sp.]